MTVAERTTPNTPLAIWQEPETVSFDLAEAESNLNGTPIDTASCSS